MNAEQAQARIDIFRSPALAALFLSQLGNNMGPRAITLDLSTARVAGLPFKVEFPFTSMTIVSASDANANFDIRVDTDASYNDSFNVKAPASLEFPLPVKAAYISNTAQAGKTVTLLFMLYGTLRTNQTSQVLSGGVTNNDGSTTTFTKKSVTAATATKLVDTDYTRKKLEFRNQTGADLWLAGDATVTDGSADSNASRGRILSDGDDYSWYNNGPLYAYSVAGGDLTLFSHF